MLKNLHEELASKVQQEMVMELDEEDEHFSGASSDSSVMVVGIPQCTGGYERPRIAEVKRIVWLVLVCPWTNSPCDYA